VTDLFLGVDAGNTKTIAAVADRSGVVLGRALGGTGDIYGVADPTEATAEVLRLVDRALAEARAALPDGAPGRIAAAAFRLAGVDWPEDERLWADVLRDHFDRDRHGPPIRMSIKNDGFALLRCSDPEGVGVAITLGTASAVAGRGRDGTEFALSWWIQHPLGGSGLVHDALRAVWLAELGLAPATTLSAELPPYFGVGTPEQVLHLFTRRRSAGEAAPQMRERAGAARIVLAQAAAGDPVAVGIVDEHARRAAGYVRACAVRVGLGPDEAFPITLGGGVATGDELLRRATTAALLRELPAAEVITEPAVPIVGTLLDALAEGGVHLHQLTCQN